eukprot:gene9049-6349_t
MSNAIEKNLQQLNLELPPAAAPAGNYVPFTVSGGLVYVSGQLPKDSNGKLITGQLGGSSTKTVHDAQEAARACTLGILTQLKAAATGLDKVKKIVKIGVFVNSSPDFTDQALVANGASDLLVAVFGEAVGRHARCAFGVAALPLGALVEVDAIAEI